MRLVCLVAVAVVVTAQEENVAPPEWFLEPGQLKGDFKARSAECENQSGSYESSKGPILIPETTEANICINFPPRTLDTGRFLPGGWRNDRGQKGSCVNECCEFLPPIKNAKKTTTIWFEGSDCSSAPASTNVGPLLFQGQNGDVKSICLEDPENKGSFINQSGSLFNCAVGCCIFYPNQE